MLWNNHHDKKAAKCNWRKVSISGLRGIFNLAREGKVDVLKWRNRNTVQAKWNGKHKGMKAIKSHRVAHTHVKPKKTTRGCQFSPIILRKRKSLIITNVDKAMD